ncbi:hypothetical protein SAMD00019534_049860 [Acytostelium subglobosum LB1]|uniref:hypothetical protein n=1 Tax=Acytostelium subglobosum LB1 TaxID=1410327 RepID=UPI000644F6FF|nr:hypothetical protein SAMD00019534_049860 [Acytostelium subglobosum LB1]GAM21811.1 hypothetical protein SAMD00019534_049860 [Acytostelium subglobosum LB1]|eukprot:XP_012754911.1 hypothetical protein SAMD00019534_049860 [Acytostelium subglobosum LB1]
MQQQQLEKGAEQSMQVDEFDAVKALVDFRFSVGSATSDEVAIVSFNELSLSSSYSNNSSASSSVSSSTFSSTSFSSTSYNSSSSTASPSCSSFSHNVLNHIDSRYQHHRIRDNPLAASCDGVDFSTFISQNYVHKKKNSINSSGGILNPNVSVNGSGNGSGSGNNSNGGSSTSTPIIVGQSVNGSGGVVSGTSSPTNSAFITSSNSSSFSNSNSNSNANSNSNSNSAPTTPTLTLIWKQKRRGPKAKQVKADEDKLPCRHEIHKFLGETDRFLYNVKQSRCRHEMTPHRCHEEGLVCLPCDRSLRVERTPDGKRRIKETRVKCRFDGCDVLVTLSNRSVHERRHLEQQQLLLQQQQQQQQLSPEQQQQQLLQLEQQHHQQYQQHQQQHLQLQLQQQQLQQQKHHHHHQHHQHAPQQQQQQQQLQQYQQLLAAKEVLMDETTA